LTKEKVKLTFEQEVIKKHESHLAKVKKMKASVNDYSTTVETDEVKNKTVEGYYKRIKNNMNVANSSIYYVCRDLYDASVNLVTTQTVDGKEYSMCEKFDELLGYLDISRSTVEKYLAIGKSKVLKELKEVNKLPLAWTTMYHITTLKEDEYEKVKDDLRSDLSIANINKIAKNDTSKKSVKNNSVAFLKLEVLKDAIDSELHDLIKAKLLNLLHDDDYFGYGSLLKFTFNSDLKKNLIKRELDQKEKDMKKIREQHKRHAKRTANGKDKWRDNQNIKTGHITQTKRLSQDKLAYKM
jgi:hypothetical protein